MMQRVAGLARSFAVQRARLSPTRAAPTLAAPLPTTARRASPSAASAMRALTTKVAAEHGATGEADSASLPGTDMQAVRWPVPSTECGSRLDRFIKRRAPGVPPGLIQRLIRQRRVHVNSTPATHNAHAVRLGDEVRFPGEIKLGLSRGKRRPPQDDVSLAEAAIARTWVLHSDARVAVLDKPPGLPCQPVDASGKTRCIEDLLAGLGAGRYWLVHRLDRDVSGALLVARDVGAAGLLAEAFRSRTIDKVYWALVSGSPDANSGALTQPIDDKRAFTSFRVLQKVDSAFTWLELRPRTGRKHQLRVHCADELGCPIVGDSVYCSGALDRNGVRAEMSGGLHLMSRSVTYPVLTATSVGARARRRNAGTRSVTVTAPLPAHMRDTWRRLGLDEKNLPDTTT